MNKLCANHEQDVGNALSDPQRANYPQSSTRVSQLSPLRAETQHEGPKAFSHLSRGPRPLY